MTRLFPRNFVTRLVGHLQGHFGDWEFRNIPLVIVALSIVLKLYLHMWQGTTVRWETHGDALYHVRQTWDSLTHYCLAYIWSDTAFPTEWRGPHIFDILN